MKLKKAISERNGYSVEELLVQVEESEKSDEYVYLLIELIESDWHIRHEDVARELQHHGNQSAVSALHRTATRKYSYLEYDNSYALARKCTWALADIGTVEAKQALQELVKQSDPEISGYAEKRLERWSLESKRKRA